ncbi:flagellar hook-length control protein FliK [Alphaproteobacteria bacterium LSUCC0719]
MLESVGGQSAVVKTGEDPQVNLTPDAETLALFAGLFAMLQTPDEAVDGEPSDNASPDNVSSELSALAAGGGATGHQSEFNDLPAAARLMLDGGQAAAMPSEQTGITQTASLASLLIAAKSLSEGADQSMAPGPQTAQGADGDAPTSITTAKAILARAIEILDDIDGSSDQVAADDLDPELNLLAPSGQLPATGDDQAATEAANSVTVQPAPSEDFIGPMPAMPVVSGVVRMITQQAPSDEFVGPMPAIPAGENAARIMTQPAPSPAFVGPMPAMVLPATVPPTTVPPTTVPPTTGGPVQLVPQPAPSPAFVGPMPLQPVPLAGQDGMGLGQAGLGQAGLGQAGLGQAGLGQAGLGQYGSWRPDVATPDEGGESLMPKRDIFDQKGGAGPGLDQIKSRQEMVMNSGPRFGPAGNQMVSPDLVPRDLRAHAEQTAMTGGHSSSGPSASGPSASGTSSSSGAASSQTIAATGQGGGQTGGHSQSGQGGGQASSYGFADTGTSRDLTDRAMLHRLNTANAGWSDTMIKRLTSDLRSGVQTVRIILEPRHLGRLNVDLGLRNGKASIRIAAETAEAAKLLGSARGQLGHMLEQSGMRLASFQTSAGGQDASMDGGAGQQGHAQPDGDGKNTGGDKGFPNKVTSADDSISQADDGLEDQGHAPRKGETAVLSILA